MRAASVPAATSPSSAVRGSLCPGALSHFCFWRLTWIKVLKKGNKAGGEAVASPGMSPGVLFGRLLSTGSLACQTLRVWLKSSPSPLPVSRQHLASHHEARHPV